MVGITFLKDYGLKNIEEYFDIIIRSHQEGQFNQMARQIQKLNWEQKKTFLKYMFEEFYLNKLMSDRDFIYISQKLIGKS